jgi:hypothetical protein
MRTVVEQMDKLTASGGGANKSPPSCQADCDRRLRRLGHEKRGGTDTGAKSLTSSLKSMLAKAGDSAFVIPIFTEEQAASINSVSTEMEEVI